MIEVNDKGDIVTINAPQSKLGLTSVDVVLSKEVMANPSLYRWNGEKIIKRRGIDAKQKHAVKCTEARQYLIETDFYVTRKLETGEAVPMEVAQKRQAARELLISNLPKFEL